MALAGATGGGKCLAYNEPVFLADGRIIKAQDLISQSVHVLGVADTQTMQQVPVLATFSGNGVREVFEIELDNGVILRRTGEHPLWGATLDENQHVGRQSNGKAMRRTRAINAGWLPAKDLRVCGNRPHFDGHVVLCSTRLHQQGQIKRSDHDVVLCAALLAEGSLSQPDRTPGFTNADAPMVALVSAAANYYMCELVPDRRQIQYRIAKIERTRKGKPRLSGNPVAQLVKDWKMNGLATQKTIPLWMFQLPDEQIALFLRVFIDCDGWFDDGTNSYPRVNVSLANPVLVQQIGQLALRLGIVGTYRAKSNGHAGCWTCSSSQVDLWQERIGSVVKAEKLARAVDAKHRMDEAATTEWKAWRDARPTDGQTFANCPEGYEWRKIVAIRRITAPTVNVEVHSENHAFVGNAVEHNSQLIRLLIAQLCAVGATVLLLNPHYTRFDLESGEDWTPFEPYLHADPMHCREYRIIAYNLRYVAEEMLPARLEKYARSQQVGAPFYIVLDELPAIVKHIPDAPGWLADILREGRKVKIFLVTAAQDFLVKTVMGKDGSGAVRDCFRTAVYVGGDPTTARVLLDVKGTVDDGGLGRGVVMLRSQQVKQAVLARVPYVDNEALYRLLGPSTFERSDTRQAPTHAPGEPMPVDSDACLDTVIVDADVPDMEALQERPSNVRTFPKQPYAKPDEPVQAMPDERLAAKKYLLTTQEIDKFIAGYKASGNMVKALAAIGKGSSYRDHARRVIEVYGLREEA